MSALYRRYPAHVVCDWIGNSEAVAAKHYLQTTDEHFAKAAQNASHNTTLEAGTNGNGSEQTCESPEETPIRPMPVVFEMSPAGLEPTTYGLKVFARLVA
jgi:hypothetical protein